MKTACKARKWGNSLGIAIPKEVVEQQHIKPDEELIITIEKKRPRLFGIMKGTKTKDLQAWRDEERRIESESEKRMYRSLGLEP